MNEQILKLKAAAFDAIDICQGDPELVDKIITATNSNIRKVCNGKET